MPTAVSNLLQSRKFAFSFFLLLCAFVLVLLKRIEWSQFVELGKWLGVSYSAATGLEALGGKSPTTGAP
jgi:hypothetical protein